MTVNCCAMVVAPGLKVGQRRQGHTCGCIKGYSSSNLDVIQVSKTRRSLNSVIKLTAKQIHRWNLFTFLVE